MIDPTTCHIIARMNAEKCTFGHRMPIDLNMLNEAIFRELKHFRPYKTYRPKFEERPVTGKFYAAHDQLEEHSLEEARRIEDYSISVEKSRVRGPQVKYPWPVTENQTYGWCSTPLVKMDRSDGRLYYPVKESVHTKTEVMIQMANPRKRK